MKNPIFARLVITIGLAYVFLSFGIGKFVSPLLWIGWIPPWMEGLLGLTRDQWLPLFGTAEILLALLLLIPKQATRRVAAVLIILYLAAVTTQTGLFSDIGVRDTGLLAAAAALFVLTRAKNGQT